MNYKIETQFLEDFKSSKEYKKLQREFQARVKIAACHWHLAQAKKFGYKEPKPTVRCVCNCE